MEEHPVPRNVTGFQFQLIGSMTLKQFGYLAFGLLIAFAAFNLPISFFRYPISLFFAAAGIAFAFLPIEERPLEVWVANLIKSMYAPTQFVWQKEAVVPDFFTIRMAPVRTKQNRPLQYESDTRSKLAAYLATAAPRENEQIDAQQDATLKRVATLFGQQIPVKNVPVQPTLKQELPKPVKLIVPTVHHTTPALPDGIISGLVQASKSPLPNALIHILNSEGSQVRLLKTNSSGKFSTSVPLEAGTYQLKTEDPKGRYLFQTIRFEVGKEEHHPWLIVPNGEMN